MIHVANSHSGILLGILLCIPSWGFGVEVVDPGITYDAIIAEVRKDVEKSAGEGYGPLSSIASGLINSESDKTALRGEVLQYMYSLLPTVNIAQGRGKVVCVVGKGERKVSIPFWSVVQGLALLRDDFMPMLEYVRISGDDLDELFSTYLESNILSIPKEWIQVARAAIAANAEKIKFYHKYTTDENHLGVSQPSTRIDQPSQSLRYIMRAHGQGLISDEVLVEAVLQERSAVSLFSRDLLGENGDGKVSDNAVEHLGRSYMAVFNCDTLRADGAQAIVRELFIQFPDAVCQKILRRLIKSKKILFNNNEFAKELIEICKRCSLSLTLALLQELKG